MKKFSVKAFIGLCTVASISLLGFATPAYAADSAVISVTSFTGRELAPAFTLSYTFNATHTDTSNTFSVDLGQLALPTTCTTTPSPTWSDCGVTTFSFTDGNNANVSTTAMTVRKYRTSTIVFTSPYGVQFAGMKSLNVSFAASTLRATSVVGSTAAVFNFHDWDLSAAYTVTAPNSYSVTFDPNNGSGSMATQSTNAVTALSNNTYTRAGYTFGGWATSQANADAGTVAYADGADYDFLAATTLYAIWTATGGSSSSGNGLANTGFSAAPYLALGCSLVLFGLSLVLYPRRRESHR